MTELGSASPRGQRPPTSPLRSGRTLPDAAL